MSYARLAGLGTLDVLDIPSRLGVPYLLTTDKVYVLRFSLDGVPIVRREQALNVIRAAGQALNSGADIRAYDVRAVVIGPCDQGDPCVQKIDAIVTVPIPVPTLPLVGKTPADIAKALEQRLGAVWPRASVPAAQFGELSGPAQAVGFWRAQPVLWDHNLTSPGGTGGPTGAFDHIADRLDAGISVGTADDGGLSRPMPIDAGPIGPGVPGSVPGVQTSNETFWWVVIPLLAVTVVGLKMAGRGR